jgi:hypothetical protein
MEICSFANLDTGVRIGIFRQAVLFVTTSNQQTKGKKQKQNKNKPKKLHITYLLWRSYLMASNFTNLTFMNLCIIIKSYRNDHKDAIV